MRKIICYLCQGIFWINDKYREHKYIEGVAVKKTGQVITCPYCGGKLINRALRVLDKKKGPNTI